MVPSEDIQKAQKLVKGSKVARLKGEEGILEGLFVVTGSKDDYLVILPNFCTCTHFHIVCIKEPGRVCKHILAARLAGEKLRVVEMEDWQNLLFRFR